MGGELFYFNQDWTLKISILATSLFKCLSTTCTMWFQHHNQNFSENLEHPRLLKHTELRLES
jgi:hypothetical protein